VGSTLAGYLLLAARAGFVTVGVGAAVLSAFSLATMPPEPPGSDGFVSGGALLVWGALLVLSLGLAGFGVALPSLVGAGDALGFDRLQRWTLAAAGGTLVAGAGLGVAGLHANSFVSMVVALLVVALGVFGVCVVLAWRLGEATWARLGVGDDGGSPD
jgi:hypothetical protein